MSSVTFGSDRSAAADWMRACAYFYWFESYLGAPEFPTSDGLLPMEPKLRQRATAHQLRCKARWLGNAKALGGTEEDFNSACIAVRGAWYGRDDIFMRIRGMACSISEPNVATVIDESRRLDEEDNYDPLF
ncbi:hypothetical protein HpMS107_23970 [Helicobacter pylori]